MHPRVSRHRSKSRSVLISRLTIPSSGRAFGTPLKSNVRRLWSRRARSSLKIRAIALSQGHLPHKARAWRVSIANASSRPGIHGKRPETLRAGKMASFGHAGLAVQAPVFEHFMRLPVPQRLKPQSSMFERFCTSPLASVAQRVCRSLRTRGWRASSRVSSSKQEQVGSYQPPNPSFKRTCLRQAA